MSELFTLLKKKNKKPSVSDYLKVKLSTIKEFPLGECVKLYHLVTSSCLAQTSRPVVVLLASFVMVISSFFLK